MDTPAIQNFSQIAAADGTPVVVLIADLSIPDTAEFVRRTFGERTVDWARRCDCRYLFAIDSTRTSINQIVASEDEVIEMQHSLMSGCLREHRARLKVFRSVSPDFEARLAAAGRVSCGQTFHILAEGHA